MIKRELKTLTSARIQMTAWIRFIRDDEEGQERVELAFNYLMTSVYRGSDLDQIVDGMIANMKFQIENPVLLNSRFVFDEVLYLVSGQLPPGQLPPDKYPQTITPLGQIPPRHLPP